MDKLPLVIIAIGAATGLFGYAKFIITGGCGEAISRFKEFGFFSFSSDVFVKSTAGYPYNKFVLIPVLIMLTAALIYCFRLMFSTSDRKGIKILSIVMLIAPIAMMAMIIGGLLSVGDSDGGSAVSGGSLGGSSGGFSGGASASGRSDSKSRDLKKKQERLDYLKKQAGEYEYYNMRQAEGAAGYQHFSAAKNREVIRDLNKEASYLEKEIAKMNK